MKIELVYFDGCPNVDATRDNLKRALAKTRTNVIVEEVDISKENVRADLRNWGSPTVLIDGIDVSSGMPGGSATCRLYEHRDGVVPEALMMNALQSSSFRLAEHHGCCIGPESADTTLALTRGQRVARAVAGILFLGLSAVIVGSGVALWGLTYLAAGVVGWFGLSHIVASWTRYPGCPELGAIPSFVLGRHVHTGCAPWRSLDRFFGSIGTKPRSGKEMTR